MFRILVSIFLMMIFLGIGVWGWSQRVMVESFFTQLMKPVQMRYLSVTHDLQSRIEPMHGMVQGASDQIEPAFNFLRDFAPVINLFSSHSGVIIDPNATLNLEQIERSFETIPSEYAQQALYGYCKQIVTEYEQRNLVE